jgi:hypothetical protein
VAPTLEAKIKTGQPIQFCSSTVVLKASDCVPADSVVFLPENQFLFFPAHERFSLRPRNAPA